MPHEMSHAVYASEAGAQNVLNDGGLSRGDVERLMVVGRLTAAIWKRWMMVIALSIAALQVFGIIQVGAVRVVIAAVVLSVFVWLLAELGATQRI